MGRDLILACDVGTSQLKLSLFDVEGRQIGTRAAGYAPTYGPGNQAEQDADDWWRAFAAAAQAMMAERQAGTALACLAFTGQMSACLPLDAAGRPVRPAMIWADQRAEQESSLLERRIGRQRLYAITGNPPSPTYTGPKILWLSRHEPAAYARAACFVQPKDFMVFRLTGNLVTDHSDASCTGLFDVLRREWSQELLEAAGVPRRLLPDAVASTQIVGTITRQAAAETGIPEGTPVVIGGGDGPASAVGAGVVDPGSGYISLGTSAWMSFASAQPLIDPQQRTFNYCHLVPDAYTPTGTMHNAGSCYAWGLDNFFHEESSTQDRASLEERINLEVGNVPPGAAGLTFLPYMLGERTPYWNTNIAGTLIGLRPHHTRYHIMRAILESIGLHLRVIADVFTEQGITSDSLTVIGGASRNATLIQFMSDIMDKRLEVRMLTMAAASFGAAVTGAVALGILDSFSTATRWRADSQTFEPQPASVPLYTPVYDRFRLAYRSTQPFYDWQAEQALAGARLEANP